MPISLDMLYWLDKLTLFDMDPDPSKNIPIKRPPVPPPIRPATPAVPSGRAQGTPMPPAAPPSPPTAPIAAKPPALVSAVQVEASKIVIRTMRDDMQEAKQGKVAPPKPAPTPPLAPPVLSPAATAQAPAQQLPLPPRSTTASTKKVTEPASARPSRHKVRALLITIFVLLLLGGGGAAAWFLWLQDLVGGFTNNEQAVLAAPAVIPANYLAIVRYQLSSAADRNIITNSWNAARDGEASVRTLLTGDPRLLVADPAVPEMYYVLLEDSTDPFLVVPKTPQTTQYLVDTGDARFMERSGWYVAHAVSVEAYQAALAEQSLAAASAPSIITDVSLGVPMRLSIGAGLLPGLRTTIAGKQYIAGQLQELSVAAALQPSTNALRLSGAAARFNPLSAEQTNHELLSFVPAAAIATRLGANFNADVTQWLSVAGIVDGAILSSEPVAGLLDQLTTPYAWFLYPSANGSRALGLVIELPVALRGKIAIGDAGLEQGLPAVLPLILDRPTIAPTVFTQVPYGNTVLRFANISGTDRALDYAVTDRHILIATSKESMTALLDTVAGTAPALDTQGVWQTLITHWGALPVAHDIIFGSIAEAGLLRLLPTVVDTAVPFGVAFTLVPGEGSTAGVSGVIDLNVSPVSQPFDSAQGKPSPSATP